MSKHKKVKARIEIRPLKVGETSAHPIDGPSFKEVFVLPADAASYNAMVEQMARATHGAIGYSRPWGSAHHATKQTYRAQSTVSLAAIGIVRPKEDSK